MPDGSRGLKLMCVLAHPDDETNGTGGTLAKYGAEGVETYVITATRGERGWFGAEEDNPGLEALGKIREAELGKAIKVLGVREHHFLDYIDGDLDQANALEAASKIAGHLRRIKPDVVVTFGPDGAYGHPDHIAICQFTTAALVQAADPGYEDGNPPHRVSKLYYMAASKELADMYQQIFGELVMRIDGVDRRMIIVPDWAITTRLDTAKYWRTVWEAICCHETQMPAYGKISQFTDEFQENLWNCQNYYRAMSLVNGGRAVERDLFEGLR
jgi:LmbE family N-acetylglucosaminyl deacetylase